MTLQCKSHYRSITNAIHLSLNKEYDDDDGDGDDVSCCVGFIRPDLTAFSVNRGKPYRKLAFVSSVYHAFFYD